MMQKFQDAICRIGIDLLKQWYNNIIDVSKDRNDIIAYCYATLDLYDSYVAKEVSDDISTKPSKPIITKGPLNKVQNNALFFIKNNNYIQKSFEKENKLIDGRKKQKPNPSDIMKSMNNYFIVNTNRLCGYFPSINEYVFDNSKEKETEFIKIAVIPFHSDRWFEYKLNNSNDTFEIVNSKNGSLINKMNNAYCRIITYLSKEKVDIIIFPELAMNHETCNHVENYMRNNTKLVENVKLVFLGSLWHNNNGTNYNTGHILINNTGLKVITTNKKQQYEHYENCKIYIEDIADDKNIECIDIKGIGRITYYICRDFLDPEITNITSGYLNSTIHIVSAYAQNNQLFIKEANTLAQNRYNITIYDNACCINTGSTSNFIEVPFIYNNFLDGIQSYDEKSNNCNCNNNFCNCVTIYNIYKKEFKKGDNFEIDVHRIEF